jgi:hypothetical protein
MARQWTNGAEEGDMLFWDSTATTTNQTGVARIGGRAWSFGNNATSSKNLTSAVSEFYIRFAIYINGTGGTQKFYWRSGSTELGSIRFNSSLKADIYTGTATLQTSGTTVFLTAAWYVIEVHVKLADSGGIIEFKIDGILQTSFSGDTKPGSETTIDNIAFNDSGTNFYTDDMGLNDTTGGSDNSWLGDAHIYALTPNANGDSSQLVNSAGNSTNNYTYVDEVPSNSDTDYVESATSGNKDLYGLSDLPTLPSGSTIARVLAETRAREITAVGDSINIGVKSGTQESWSTNKVVGTSYQRQWAEWTTDPNTGVGWTESGVNAMQAGVKIV